MSGSLLVLNAGSSSLKFSLFEHGTSSWPPLLAHGEVGAIETAPQLLLRGPDGKPLDPGFPVRFDGVGHDQVLASLERLFESLFDQHPLTAVGHRVVHGGEHSEAACRVDAAVLAELASLSRLAPLHQPHNLAPIASWLKRRPELPQFAAFDTAFHHSIPRQRTRYPLPAALAGPQVRRYGFHGLSYEYLARRLGELEPAAGGRCVALHLGAGASVCAMAAGRSVATSMGFTALDGLPMATRCGNLDPGAVLHLLEDGDLAPAELRERLYHDSGLLALSGGLSGDMRTLLASQDDAAREAVDHFCWRARREIGAMAAELGGLDTLVFTGGIGEHAAEVRAAILSGLEFLGVRLDASANQAQAGRISAADSPVRIRVIATDEELMVAHHVQARLA